MITFAEFYTRVKAQAAPEGIGENLVSVFRTAVQNGLIAVQTDVPCYRDFHVDFVTKSYVRDFCNTDIFTGPRGTILNVYAFLPGKDCTKYFYTQKSTSHIQCWIDQQRCTTPACASATPSHTIYDSPYCNYPIAGTEGCLPPYLPVGATESDTSFIADCTEHSFAVGPNYQVFLAPRFPCGYVVAVQWEGIKRTWADTDPVFDDQDLTMAVAKFAEAQLSAKDRQWADVNGLKADFIDLVRQMAQRCRRERRTSPPRDCSALIDHILPLVNPTPDSVSLAIYPDGTPGADTAPLAPSPNLISINTGHLLWVDAVYGNDTLALREREDRPYLTITAAKNAALSGDTIIIRPGTYNENNLAKDGVRYDFIDGAKLTFTDPGSGPGYGFFDDRPTGAISFSVTGSVEMTYLNSNPFNTNCHGAVTIQNGSLFDFNGKRATVSCTSGPSALQSFGAFFIKLCANGSSIDMDDLTDTFQTWSDLDPDDPQPVPSYAMGVYWGSGDLHVSVRRNTMNKLYCLWCDEPVAGASTNLWYNGQLCSTNDPGAASTFYVSSPSGLSSASYRVWFNCLETLSLNTAIDCLTNGKVYVTGQKVQGATAFFYSGTELWVEVEKVSATTQWINQSPYSGNSHDAHFDVQHFEDIGSVTSGILNSSSANLFIHGGYLKSGATGSVLVSHTGTGHTKLIGCTLDATAHNISTNRPITVTTDGLQIQNCVILAGSNADSSIFASAAKNVRMHTYSVTTKAAHGNITLNPSSTYLIVDANAGL